MTVINLNRVVLTGQISGGDPQLETLPSGFPMCAFEVEVHRRRQDPDTGVWGERIVHVDVAIFGSYAESTARYLYVGRPVAIDGWLDVRTADRERDNFVRQMRVVADTVQFIGAPPDLDHEDAPIDAREVSALVTS